MSKNMRWILCLSIAITVGLFPIACAEKEGQMEKAGKKADEMIDDAGDAIEEAGDKIEDVADDIGDSVEDMGDKAEDLAEDLDKEAKEVKDDIEDKTDSDS